MRRAKHIDVRLHFLRDVIAQGAIAVRKIGTTENPTNMMTNVIHTVKFRHCLDLIVVFNC